MAREFLVAGLSSRMERVVDLEGAPWPEAGPWFAHAAPLLAGAIAGVFAPASRGQQRGWVFADGARDGASERRGVAIHARQTPHADGRAWLRLRGESWWPRLSDLHRGWRARPDLTRVPHAEELPGVVPVIASALHGMVPGVCLNWSGHADSFDDALGAARRLDFLTGVASRAATAFLLDRFGPPSPRGEDVVSVAADMAFADLVPALLRLATMLEAARAAAGSPLWIDPSARAAFDALRTGRDPRGAVPIERWQAAHDWCQERIIAGQAGGDRGAGAWALLLKRAMADSAPGVFQLGLREDPQGGDGMPYLRWAQARAAIDPARAELAELFDDGNAAEDALSEAFGTGGARGD